MLHHIIKYSSMRQYAAVCGSMLPRICEYSSMPHLSRYHTLHIVVRGMRIWPPNAAKCCKNAGKFFPDVYNWIIYKQESKARERKGEEQQRRSKLCTILWSRDGNLPLRDGNLPQSDGSLPVL